MRDRWFAEITFQKNFGFSPKEAECYVLSQFGLSQKEIAMLKKINPQTVQTNMTRAKNKIQACKGTLNYAIYRGDADIDGMNAIYSDLGCVIRFLVKAMPNLAFHNGDNMWILEGFDESEPGDTQWVYDNVFRRVYLDNALSDREMDDKGELLLKTLKSQEGYQDHKIGHGILDYYIALTMYDGYVQKWRNDDESCENEEAYD